MNGYQFPNLGIKYVKNATARSDGAYQSVLWLPQNVKNGGVIIQHAKGTIKYTELRCAIGRWWYNNIFYHHDQTLDFFEAWKVDRNAKVTPALIGAAGTRNDEFALQNVIPESSGGYIELRGYARYLDGESVDWKANENHPSGILPMSLTAPAGWSDKGTTTHGYLISWNRIPYDFIGEPRVGPSNYEPRVDQEW